MKNLDIDKETMEINLKAKPACRPTRKPQTTAAHRRPPQDRMGSCKATNLSL